MKVNIFKPLRGSSHSDGENRAWSAAELRYL